jgi:hypothetical protein
MDYKREARHWVIPLPRPGGRIVRAQAAQHLAGSVMAPPERAFECTDQVRATSDITHRMDSRGRCVNLGQYRGISVFFFEYLRDFRAQATLIFKLLSRF